MSKWTKSEIEDFINSFDWYQLFNIPPFENINGRFGYLDRETLNPALLPRNLKGKTFLEIGCNTGKYCLEAKLRGAAKVVGIDNNKNCIERAQKIAQITNIGNIEYIYMDANMASTLGKFDYTAMFSVIHLKSVKTPLLLLQEAYKATNEVFITEIYTRFFWRSMYKFGLKIFIKHPYPTTQSMISILKEEIGFKKVEYAGKNKNDRDLFICFKK
ncbi:MAG: hypothetical protein UU05_C0001G0081 [Candidatus Curtissbacteria bacterium GW2011_GWA1_40_47]|uniref:Methyltransferase domain-containing protein n=1 Tax=Candidatus Curtissbacteria bacterium RIFOXYA1_FULL_41_14 TaxID=1797737 RepID=A0A1F5HAV8_9BACT|nr:MAG: hypothetical protein UT95_C0001G0056 [Candidatus Curtissbacteria bacterium GW2011_GWB1_40_28]KKR62342.1 MAG: hypothetical protein UU00_C0001G0062 [Microgenomates group bacterium GW2011_GWC1_40_35]KKR66457.1 MAG: hypothetical protein UU05_C0001G0081 [Candidatus Curtissbacteria bacterium GW2011_GWA1_40_47]KKR77883.1 MAG: hypothetical protein UU19_C0001G0029 [Candidatus Curtissbacteria bacterium GW2011_GWD1_40_8]KKS02510.1 MAG: hypothetical protein UU53_C0001G0055 [Candidatus Curtissbacter